MDKEQGDDINELASDYVLEEVTDEDGNEEYKKENLESDKNNLICDEDE